MKTKKKLIAVLLLVTLAVAGILVYLAVQSINDKAKETVVTDEAVEVIDDSTSNVAQTELSIATQIKMEQMLRICGNPFPTQNTYKNNYFTTKYKFLQRLQ